MTTLTLDPVTASRFRELHSPVSVCDTNGNILGRFVPLSSNVDPEALVPQVSEAELKRRAAETGGRSLSEILTDLKGKV